MRNLNFEAAIWNLFTSAEFYEAVARECDAVADWFGNLAIAREVANFGRNNQIYDQFKQRARDFRQGAELAKFGDYTSIWDISGSVGGDARGIMEQPLLSWMTIADYQEFSRVRIGRVLKYAARIESALNNAMMKADSFFDPDPDCPERRDDDDGYPGDDIVRWYNDYINFDKGQLLPKLPQPLPEYVIDTSISCQTGDEVPWTGVWHPNTGLERHSLTFAIKGLRMQPVFRVIKTTEELRSEEAMFPAPETVAVATTWHPVTRSGRSADLDKELWAKAGERCPRAGVWQPTDPGAPQRTYEAGETMADLGSTYGISVWRWVAER